MAMRDVLALLRYWRDAPPVHELLAVALGLDPSRRAERGGGDPSGIGPLLARAPDGRLTQ